MSIAAQPPSLFDRILGIILVRSQKHVPGIATSAVIAPVADQHSFWDWSFDDCPSESVRQPVGGVTGAKLPVTSARCFRLLLNPSGPEPAGVCPSAFHFFPKRLFDLVLVEFWSGHSLTLSQGMEQAQSIFLHDPRKSFPFRSPRPGNSNRSKRRTPAARGLAHHHPPPGFQSQGSFDTAWLEYHRR